ncbi:MAG: T9SS type A sorting domain-containing protein [Bacteroidales bacterium]|nr:T9SS type A sorting domain-containing protein [Bacteroidales bacterium]
MRKLIISTLLICLLSANIVNSNNGNRIPLKQDRTSLSVKIDSPSLIRIHNSLAELNLKEIKTKAGIFTSLVIEGYTNNHKAGYPELPVLCKIIEVPHGAEIKINIISYDTEIISLTSLGINAKIIPSQPPVSKSLDPDEIEFVYNEAAYAVDKFISPVPASVEIIGKMRGRQLASLTISPFKYNPVTNVLEVLNNIELEIIFESADFAATRNQKEKYYSPAFEMEFSKMINYQAPDSKDSLSKYPIKYVIVADPMFQTVLQPFVEWKTKKGFTVIEAYTNNPGVGNTTTSIKTYLEGLYNAGTTSDPAPTYILFAGDVAQVPSFQAGGHVSDLYYCEYDGGGDYFPEVYYGRFSANNPEELEPQINKTLEYEQYLMPDVSFLDEVVMISGVDAGYAPIHGNGQINYGTDNYFNPAHGLLSHTYLYPASGSSSSQIIQNVSDGVAYANYTAHGSSNGWADPSFNKSDIGGLQNAHKYPLMVGNCCVTNTFDNPECFGEALLRAIDKGAIGYIGASANTYWDEDYYWGVGAGPIILNPTYAQTGMGAYDGTFHDNGEPMSQWYPTQGQMMFAGNLAVTAGSPSTAQYYWEIYHLMGDPSVMIYFSTPAPLLANHYASVPIGMNSLTVTTEPEAYVAISFNGVLLDAQIADATGVVNLVFSPLANVGTADVVATKQNREPYIGIVNVIPGNTPFVIFTSCTVDDSKGNSNGQADFDEDILLDIDLENVGSQMAQGVEATITSSDQFITITDNTELWGNIAPTSTSLVNGAFEFIISDSIPDQHNVSFNIDISDNAGGNWSSVFNIVVNAPDLQIGNMFVNDVAGGNGNGVIDPGETIEITIQCMNDGHSDAPSSEGIMISSSIYVNIVNSNIALGDIQIGNMTNATYTVVVDAATPVGTPLDFNFSLSSGNYSVQSGFGLKVGIIAEDFETGDLLKFPWKNIGSNPWIITTNNPYEGIYCAVSGDISGNQTSEMSITMDVVVDDSISFFMKVSSEYDYDFLKFFIDNQMQAQWSGEESWTRISFPVSAGVHIFKWLYEKDFWASNGDDCGWIDYVVFPPVSISTSTEDISFEDQPTLNIYPNPFTDILTVDYSVKNSGFKILLINSIGQELKVFTQKELNPSGNNSFKMNLRELKSGTYFLKLETGNNVIIKRLIKS